MKNRLFPFLSDPEYLRGLSSIAVPIIVQMAITSALNAVDILMIGQLGEVQVAAVGLANQIGFLMFFILFGTVSGGGAFVAQYWGKEDLESIHKVQGITLSIAWAVSLVFTLLAQTVPSAALGLFTRDPAVIEAGSRYLRLVSLNYVITATTFCFAMVHRSTGYVRLPAATGTFAIIIKTVISYALIFGTLGLPKLGIVGAAVGTVIARALELVFMLAYTYRNRLPAAAAPRQLYSFDRTYLKPFLVVALPVIINETLWSLGITTYNAIYARIGTQSIAAYNIAATIEGMAFVLFTGVTDACAIMVGNRLGRGENEKAYRYAIWSLRLNMAGGVLVGLVIIAVSFFLPSLYNISSEAREYARNILIIMGSCIWIRVSVMICIVGIFRSGGDTRFSAILEGGTLWLIGVPSALIGAFVFHLSIYWVYLLVMLEELVKLIISLWRVRSRRWMRNLTNLHT